MSKQLHTANQAPALPKFMSVKEVAEMLGVSTRSVYDWISQDKIPYRKAGDRTIFLVSEILEWTKPKAAA